MNNPINVRSRFAHIHNNSNGQGLIETALVITFLLLLLVGAIDFGRAFHDSIIVTNASREGARYASRFPADVAGIKQAAVGEAALEGITLNTSDVDVVFPVGQTAGEQVTVGITYQFQTILGSMFGYSTMSIRTETAMLIFGLDP